MLLNFKKSQVTVYFISVIAILISLAFVVIMVGKTAKDKTYADNAADAGALAACSIMAQAFNDNSAANGLEDGANGEERADEMAHNSKNAGEREEADRRRYYESVLPTSKAATPPGTSGWQHGAGEQIEGMKEENRQIERNTTKSWERGQKEHQNAANNMQEYTDNAIAEGYQLCFRNSGISHRLGKLSSKLYQNFLKSLQPGAVKSGEPKTFAWVDGAARFHIVTCIIELEPTDNWIITTSVDSYSTTMNKFTEANMAYNESQASHAAGEASAQIAEALYPCGIWQPPHAATHAHNSVGHTIANDGTRQSEEASAKEMNEEKKVEKAKQVNPDDHIAYRSDIIHSRMVVAMNFQFHMGSPIKSTWGDIDEMTFYPPVFATAIASFNYTGKGNISRGGDATKGSDPRHECGLIAAF